MKAEAVYEYNNLRVINYDNLTIAISNIHVVYYNFQIQDLLN